MRDNILKDVYNNQLVELNSIEVKLGKLDDIEKLKKSLLDKIKNHFNKRNEWGAESSKVLALVGDIERKGIDLKKETNVLEKELNYIYTETSNLRKQADSLGLELPESIFLLDGRAISSYGNSFADTNIIVDKFKDNLK
jgi:hypothetical protein